MITNRPFPEGHRSGSRDRRLSSPSIWGSWHRRVDPVREVSEMKQNPFPQSFVMRQKHHSLSLGLAVGWSGFLSPHFFQISPKSLKFPLQSFHASLSYERVKPQCLAQSMGRGSASRKPQVEREPNREAANSIQDKLLPPYHAPLGLPIRCHQQGTKRGCVQRYSMFLCQGPEGSSCHLARLRIPGQNLNH